MNNPEAELRGILGYIAKDYNDLNTTISVNLFNLRQTNKKNASTLPKAEP